MASKATYGVFGAALFVFALFGGCDGSRLKSRQADGGLGGSGGSQAGGSATGGAHASGGSSEQGGVVGSGGAVASGGVVGNGGTNASGGGSGSGGAISDAGCAPGWTLCCGQCLGPTAGVCAPCSVGGTSGSGGKAGADASSGVDVGMGPADARPDSGAGEVGADARQDSGGVEVPADVNGMTSFIDQMNGLWLVGWMGDMNHYSWVRIRSSSSGSGTGSAEFLAGDDLAINAPYWPCSGQGQWMIPAKPRSILFTFPASCPSGMQAEYTFDPFREPGSYPKGAILSATVTPLSGTITLQGYKFPDAQCNADMTSCSDPL